MDAWQPSSPEKLYITVVAMVDIGGTPGNLFRMFVTSPEALAARRTRYPEMGDYEEQSCYMLCTQFSWSVVRAELERRMELCAASTADQVLAKLRVWFLWEFEYVVGWNEEKQEWVPWEERSVEYYRREEERDLERIRQQELNGDNEVQYIVFDPLTGRVMGLVDDGPDEK